MPATVSKLRFKPRMADPKRVGRVFCVTGVQTDNSLVFQQTKNNTSHSDTESNSSGYISSSSLEYSGEDKRILPNEHKVFQMWERWSQHLPVPKSSTPKENSTVRRVTGSNENLLAIRKTLGKSRVSQQADSKQEKKNPNEDSFWDIELPERVSVCSVSSDSERPHNTNTERPRSVPLSKSHDAGSEIPPLRRSSADTCTSSSNDWRRRPFLTSSNSESDLRTCQKTRQHSGSSSDSNISGNRNSLPRYRVKVDSDSEVSPNIAKHLSEPSTDYYDEGVPVDESMTEFISSVDTNNLAGILQFYDHVTSESAYRQPRKSRYESVYF